MKKFFVIMAMAVMAVSANAQVYVGGGVGLASISVSGGDDVTAFKLLPEVGYNFNQDWAAGVAFGWAGINKGGEKAFSVNPYARYTFVHTDLVNVFIDGGVTYEHEYGNNSYGKIDNDNLSIGFKPGVALNLSKNLSFVAHFGFLGWEQEKDNNTKTKTNKWGVNIDGNNIQFGLYLNF